MPPVLFDTPIKPTAAASTSGNETFIIYHAFFVSLGFLVLLPAGSLIGRWARAFTPKWFKIHRLVNMSFALPIITLGVLLGPVVVITKPTFRIHFANAHEVKHLIAGKYETHPFIFIRFVALSFSFCTTHK